ncbi:J domain-containing protein [Methylobacterium nodulans]|uniref:Heat shock protein DnaJ domain protein n=1 Tax=Methylobacterium nodulans (strain LMG 21967 / CNCM I-2342 / ORS 2060) TaxID=460265 RepID=B8IG22_METNO|nr:DnaJ domain-containing protein [Methylobacterium nodulans]ACL61499.1 heat shock protein DnaJ domain protein [Methylobacterium nodulans ORS 2060]
MDLNSPLFDRIRIKPTCDDAAAEGPVCERPGCTQPGLHRAPKGRRQEGQYWRFCMEHVREYNASYNYFAGMNDAAVQAFQKDAVIGHRPTWSMGVNRAGRGAGKPSAATRDWDYVDPLGILRAGGIGPDRGRAKAEPQRPRFSAPVRKALDVMGLDEGADAAAIKAQYKVLVKRFHPDANGGDRSFEDRLRDIIRAHDTLRAAGLC